MDIFRIAVKVFATADDFAPETFVPIFHHWIQGQSFEGHRLIDVADYGHVVHGPGTVLVSSEANFYTDRSGGRLGLLYSRKLPVPGDFRQRLRFVVKEALRSAAKLEAEPALAGKLKFKCDEILVRLNDRLAAPPCAETAKAAQPDIDNLAQWLFGEGAKAEGHWSDLTLVEYTIRGRQPSSLAQLLSR